MLRRLLGILILFIGLSGLFINVAAIVVGRDLVDGAAGAFDEALGLTGDALTTTRDSLVLAKSTLEQVNEAVASASSVSGDVAKTMDDVRPLIDQTKTVAVDQVPGSLEAIEEAIPDLAEAAAAIDSTLRTLNAFQFRRELPLVGAIGFDLGIDYEPEAPLDEAVLTLGTSMVGLSDDLRALEPSLILADENLAAIGTNMEAIADNLESLRTDMDDALPLLDDYITLVQDTTEVVRRARLDLGEEMERLKLQLTIFFVWITLYQLVPLTVGWYALTSRRESAPPEPTVIAADEVMVVERSERENAGGA